MRLPKFANFGSLALISYVTLYNFLLGVILAFLIAALAYRRGSLSTSGAVGAVIVGTLIFAIGGLSWATLLITFFVTSSALSHYQERTKEPLAEKFQKGHRRDLGQVWANGGWGALLALAYAFVPQPILFVAFVGAMATVNADTWATELGVLSKTAPRLITTGRVVAVGTSGGVTSFGTFVAFCGALLIGTLAFAARIEIGDWRLIPIGTVAGLIGSLFDSLLGATVQAIYYCDFDQKETESAIHRCGRATRLLRGWRWLDNDWVNFISSVVGAALAAGLWLLVQLVLG
jgi:uncharacterized protein (TIGR00297 family)